MTSIYIAAFGCLALSIPIAIWIKKRLSTSTKLIVLPIFLIIANEVKFTSQNFPDWLNIVLMFIFSVVCGGVMVYIGCEVLNIWSKISPTETSESRFNESSSRNKFKEPRGILEHLDCVARENEIKNLSDRKYDLEFERGQLRTSNTLLDDWIGNKVSPSELERNRKRHEYLSREIEDLEGKLQRLKDK